MSPKPPTPPNKKAAPEHLLIAPGKHATALNEIDRALLTLVPTGSHRLLERLFGNRTTSGTIRQWRYGRRAAPAWAREIMRRRLNEELQTLTHIAAMLDSLKPGPGKGWRAKNKPPAF